MTPAAKIYLIADVSGGGWSGQCAPTPYTGGIYGVFLYRLYPIPYILGISFERSLGSK